MQYYIQLALMLLTKELYQHIDLMYYNHYDKSTRKACFGHHIKLVSGPDLNLAMINGIYRPDGYFSYDSLCEGALLIPQYTVTSYQILRTSDDVINLIFIVIFQCCFPIASFIASVQID